MPVPPTNPGPTDAVRASRKRKAPLNDNGDPVNMNPQKMRKTSAAIPPKKKVAPEKPVPAKRRPSVEMEEVPDNSERFQSEVPHNPRNILEAADGSDDEVPPVVTPDSEDEPEIVEKVEEVEEDDDAELSNVSVTFE